MTGQPEHPEQPEEPERLGSINMRGESKDLSKPGEIPKEGFSSDESFARYFDMPYRRFEGVQCPSHRIAEVKSQLESMLRRVRDERPCPTVGRALFKYWGMVEAHCSYMPDAVMQQVCATYIRGLRELGLQDKMSMPVLELDLER